MFNVVMALISAVNLFMAARGFYDYVHLPDLKTAAGCTLSLTLAIWSAIKAIKET